MAPLSSICGVGLTEILWQGLAAWHPEAQPELSRETEGPCAPWDQASPHRKLPVPWPAGPSPRRGRQGRCCWTTGEHEVPTTVALVLDLCLKSVGMFCDLMILP